MDIEDVSTEEFSDVSQDKEESLLKPDCEQNEQIMEIKNKLRKLENDCLPELLKVHYLNKIAEIPSAMKKCDEKMASKKILENLGNPVDNIFANFGLIDNNCIFPSCLLDGNWHKPSCLSEFQNFLEFFFENFFSSQCLLDEISCILFPLAKTVKLKFQKWKRLETKAQNEKKILYAYRGFLHQSISAECQADLYEADSELEGKREELRSKLLAELEEKKRALELERSQV